MQIHIVQCAKYRLYQEGYSKAYHRCTHTMDSVFVHLEQLTINLSRTWLSLEHSWWRITGKDSFSIHLSIFFYWLFLNGHFSVCKLHPCILLCLRNIINGFSIVVPYQSLKSAKHAPNFPKGNLLYPFHQACIRHDSSGLGTAGYSTTHFISVSRSSSKGKKKVCASKYQHPSMNYCRSNDQSYILWIEKWRCLNRLIDVIIAETR